MYDLLITFITTFIDISYNIWPWFLIVTAPTLILIMASQTLPWAHFFKLIIAIFLTYIFINLSLHTSQSISWNEYQTCQSQFADGTTQHHPECGERNIADGASAVFYLFLGWIPAAGYVGFWEFIWRIRYRKKTQQSKQLKYYRWFSNCIIVITLIVTSYVGFIAFLLVKYFMNHP